MADGELRATNPHLTAFCIREEHSSKELKMTDTRDTIRDGVRDTVRDASNAVTNANQNSTTMIATIVAVVAVALLALYAFGVFGTRTTTLDGVAAPTMTTTTP